jgi:hypothetical protein
MRQQLNFFAQQEDIVPILEEIEKEIYIRYFKAGLFDHNIVENYDTIRQIPYTDFAKSGDWNRIDRYLMAKKDTDVQIRQVPQRTGGKKFAIDQLINPDSIEMKLGGLVKDSINVIVAGRIATVSDNSFAQEIFKVFSSKMKKWFEKIGSFYVGERAAEKLDLGWRLVTNEKSPREYDLKR